jgi:SAM-dependent methyltransferase
VSDPIRGGGGPAPAEMWRIGRLALRHRSDPMPYARSIADLTLRYLRARGIRIQGRWLDVGTGNGVLPAAVMAAGAERAIGLDTEDRRIDGARCLPFVRARAQEIPFADGAFDGVLSSNVLEHTGDVDLSIRELLRVCKPGGVVYLSWTNWYSPMGGHEWSPFHYLGPRLGPEAYRLVRGKPPRWNVPGRTLFPVHVAGVLREVHGIDARVLDVAPRYWPRLRMLALVPAIREVAMWNCVILLRPGRSS